MALVNLRPVTYVIISIAFALGTASIFLRLYCRWRLQIFGRDDAVAIFLFVRGMSCVRWSDADKSSSSTRCSRASSTYSFLMGVGCELDHPRSLKSGANCIRPADQTPPGTLEHIQKVLAQIDTFLAIERRSADTHTSLQWLFVEEVFYMFVHFTLKQAFLVFYLRLSPRRDFHMVIYGTMAMCTMFLAVEWLLAFLQAQPLAAMFHPESYPNAKFLSQYVVQMVPTALVRINLG